MTDLAMGHDRWMDTRSAWDQREDTGRHAFDEDALLTPIFHALTSGGWQQRQHEPAAEHRLGTRRTDPVDEFRRDPLTAPIPVQAIAEAAVPTQTWGRAPRRRPIDDPGLTDSGRHRRITESWGR